MWTRMKYDPGFKAVPDFRSKPFKVISSFTVWCGVGLDLYSDDSISGKLNYKINLMTALLLPEVVEAGRQFRGLELSAPLGYYERLENLPHQFPIADDRIHIQVQRCSK